TAKLSKAAKEKIRESAGIGNGLLQVGDRKDGEEPAGQPSSSSSKGHLPIDELIKFITGSGNKSGGSAKPKPSGGPRGKGPKGSRR
ncbi:hypothetical protein IWW38_006152, partial [Coemansia aciculifera]